MDILGFEKLIYHADRLKNVRDGKKQFPLNITLSLGNYCNHACLWCSAYAFQQKDVKHTDYDKMLDFLRRAWGKGSRAITYVGNGEPLAYPKFREFVTEAHRIGYEQGMFTNGFLLDRFEKEVMDYFTFFRISLDAGSTEVHNEMHDVKDQFDKIIQNVAQIVKKRKNKKPTVGFQYATHHRNLADMYQSAKIGKEIGIDYFSVKPVFTRGSVEGNQAGPPSPQIRIERNELTFEKMNKAVAEIKKDLESRDFQVFHRPFQIQSHEQEKVIYDYKQCFAGFFNVNVYEDGKIIYCGPHHIGVGTIEDDLNVVEDRILALSKKLDLSKCPAGCRYHPLNHIMDTYLYPEKAAIYHPNFV